MAIIIGTFFDDLLSSKRLGDIIFGRNGNDTLTARHGLNLLFGGEGDDQLIAISSFNILSGDAGNDFLQADRGWNLLSGGAGNDIFFSFADHNILNGDAGNDELYLLEGVENVLNGGDGDDLIRSASDNNDLHGNAGNDNLGVDFGSANLLSGGEGDDFLAAHFANDNLLRGDAGNDTLLVLEGNGNILHGGDGHDFLETQTGSNILNGEAGDDIFLFTGDGNVANGGDGDDVLTGFSSNMGVFNGDEGNDFIEVNGDSGNVLNGGEGDDTVQVAGSGNTANGDGGNDRLLVFDGSGNSLYGGEGHDVLSDASGDNSLSGDAGDDTITGGAGNDALSGGDGIDTLSYADSPTRAIVNMFGTTTIVIGGVAVGPGTTFDGFGTFDTISGFENVIGTPFNDFLQGSTNVANRLEGGSGNDTLVGSGMSDSIAGAADDTLLGGGGDDVLRQTRGHDFLDGGNGFNDRLEFVNTGIAYSGAVGVSVDLGAGTSNADASGSDTVNGDGGNVASISNIEVVFGTAGTDLLVGGSRAQTGSGNFTEVFRSGAGNDTIDGRGTDTEQGKYSFDRVEYFDDPAAVIVNLGLAPIVVGDETIAGGTARDGFGTTDTLLHVNHVMGSAFNDTLIGGNPEYDHTFERFEGRGGSDYMDGGSGIDEVSYQNGTAGIAANLGTGIGGTGGADTFVNMEGIRGSPFNDTLTGSNNVNIVEHFIGAGGNDTIDGGAGIDFASWQGADLTAGGVSAFIQDGSGTGTHGLAGIDSLTNIEGLIGTNANDTLAGGLGDQWFRGQGGSDNIDGGAGTDTADYSMDPGAVTVNLSFNFAADGWGGIWELQGFDTLFNIENVRGSRFDDVISGDANANLLEGGAGNDTFTHVQGFDVDTISGGAGTDTLSFTNSASVIVNMLGTGFITVGSNTVQPGSMFDGFFGGNDTISGFENVIGTPFNDFLQGSTNVANRLEGGSGNDTLVGSGMSDSIAGAADDTLLGGGGDDVLRQTRGHDFLDGGNGFNDRLEFVNTGIAYSGAVGVSVDLGAGTSNADASGSDTVNGDGGNVASISNIEVVFGTAGTDLLVGGSRAQTGSGNFTEVFRSGAGNDTIDGRGTDTEQGAYSFDRVEYFDDPAAVIVNLGLAPIVVGDETIAGGTARDGFGTTDTLLHVNHVMGSAFNDTLIGGNPEYDHTFERFEGRGGSDYMDGGSGIDEVSYQNGTAGIAANLGTGIGGTGGADTFVNMEGIRGSPFNDTLTGSNNVNIVEHFIGAGGNDTIDGGAGIDFASWQGADLTAGGVSAFIQDGSGTGTHGLAGIDSLTNIEGLIGTNANDTLAGGLGDQWFRGQGGSDNIDGGAGTDTADYSMDPGAVTVNLSFNFAADGWGGIWELQGFDTLFNIENVRGSRFNDSLAGDGNANVIDGGGGADTLEGGAGMDQFQFGPAAVNNLVLDFAGDVLDLSSLLAANGVQAPAGENALDWLVNNGYLQADSSANLLGGAANDTAVRVDVDGSAGAGAAYTVATLVDSILGTSDGSNWAV